MIHKASFAAALGLGAVALAGPVKFEFDANTFLDTSSSVVAARADQVNPRLIVRSGVDGSGLARTYTSMTGPQPDELNAYLNWVDGLNSPGEGITQFNMWVTTAGYPNNPHDSPTAGAWAQGIYRDGTLGDTATGISATAPTGWTATVAEIYGGTYGVIWNTSDPSLSLRPTSLGGTDLGAFSFTMADTNAVDGQSYRVWFGTSNSSTDSSITFDNAGWGARATPIGPYASALGDGGASGTNWNGVITVTAAAVPEPISLGLFGLGVLGAIKRKRS